MARLLGDEVYVYNTEPVASTTGRCTCGGKVKVIMSRGGNYIGALPTQIAEKLKLDQGCAERLIIVVPED